MGCSQASRAEVDSALAQRGVCELDRRWQVPSKAFTATLLNLLLLTARHQGWPLTHLPETEACKILQQDGYDPRYAAVLKCLRAHKYLE